MKKTKKPLSTGKKLLIALVLLALVVGIVFWAIRYEVAAVHVMGLVMLVVSMLINSGVRRINS